MYHYLLEKLVLRYAAFTIADIENFHAAATKLKHLEFKNLAIYTEDAAINQNHPYPTANLEYFSLTTDSAPIQQITHGGAASANTIFVDTIGAWILYIGMKYPYLQDLHLKDLALQYKRLDLHLKV